MTTPVPSSDGDGYASLLAELKDRIRTARLKAAVAVNRELILLYWSIGPSDQRGMGDPCDRSARCGSSSRFS